MPEGPLPRPVLFLQCLQEFTNVIAADELLKTSKKDEFDHFNHDEREMSKFRADAQRRIQKMLSHIELILVEIDRRIESNLTRMPIHLEAEIELSLEKNLRDFVVFDRLRI